ncbi:MAG TPA: RNA polymerase-binding protein DksA [Burkholderiaceae bacterium]|nr:RNA polymerase-binding protein DksA [Burkholderiaceae bacterium]
MSKTPAKSAPAPSKTAAKKAHAQPKSATHKAHGAAVDHDEGASSHADMAVGTQMHGDADLQHRQGAVAEAPGAAENAASSNPEASRFADRFAPPKPPARMIHEVSDVHKPASKADPKLANAWKHKAGRDLSEEELLAMPDAEYMNEKQLDFFRARLQALKDDLLSNAGLTTEHLREDTSIVPDPADRATIEEEHALELRTRDRERKLLKKISQSLARIEAGDYGFCDETGEPIGLGRLLARPTATLSLEAQQRRELKQKMFGD